MKADYEHRTRTFLPRRTHTLLRVDGKAFHTFTRNLPRPLDPDLMADMDAAAIALCENIEGARFAFVQSDEISVLLTDFDNMHTQAWFDGNIQKIASVSASIATAHFNRAREKRLFPEQRATAPLAYFDSRVWTIPQRIEVFNYFLWRQQDATRNSVSMTAQAHFPHARLQGLSNSELQELLWREAGINWNDLPVGFKRGRVVERVATVRDMEYVDKRTGETRQQQGVTRHEWRVTHPPVFSQERDWLLSRIPAQSGVVEGDAT